MIVITPVQGDTKYLSDKNIKPLLGKPLIGWTVEAALAANNIDEGFPTLQGIGNRNSIGKRFTVYQGCTIGHTVDAGKRCIIGNDVTLFANSLVLEELTIGGNVVIGSNSLVLKDVPANHVAKNSPAGFTPRTKTGHN
ncbi:cytidylyltransferase domain-containing protein [Maridesulfovibrio hydrothermalis]|uniref:Transferase hexapeptide (Six repeat-containing protein) n=1 Tax=Maridesulfovibrio hydrothermalis AM13 = DSM 14728 TaxID=1121451 RepID=L0R8Z6_9BACT|nr:hypothetical protein [Maridesulfovibrio hydrothermalis]CCO23233.1 protein of unknown function [Maridesulfovibrio hydrothermalis AM13 = DSM 14728]